MKGFKKYLPLVMVLVALSLAAFAPMAPAPEPVDWLDVLPIQEIASLVVALLGALLVPVAGQLSKALVAWANAKKADMNETQQRILRIAVKSAVFAVEQLYEGLDGEEKLAAAIDMVELQLAQYGAEVDLSVLVNEIEAAVKEELSKLDV